MNKFFGVMMALAMVGAPLAASAATTAAPQNNPNFSQGKQAPVLSDGPSTGYNSAGRR